MDQTISSYKAQQQTQTVAHLEDSVSPVYSKKSNTDAEKEVRWFSDTETFNRPGGNCFLQKSDIDFFPDPALS